MNDFKENVYSFDAACVTYFLYCFLCVLASGGRFELQDVCLFKDTLHRPMGEAIMRGWLSDRNKEQIHLTEWRVFLSGYVQMFVISEMVKCLIQE